MLSRLASLLLFALVLPGCATTFSGGPKTPFDLAQVEKSSNFADPVASFNNLTADACDKDCRNKEMNKMLALVDIRYSQFRRELELSKKNSSTAVSGLLLASNVAGGLTNSKGVKDNWLALSNLASGGQLIFDKNYLFDQTLSALISQMDANRKRKLLEIRTAMATKDAKDYPGQVALTDILEYHYAGTLMGAITAIQQTSSNDADASARQLRTLDDATMEEIKATQDVTTRLYNLVQGLKPTDELILKGFLAGQQVEVRAPGGKPELLSAVRALHNGKFRRNGEDLIALIEKAGLKVP